MAGSFEEQATVMSSSVGAPWMSRNEARARLNLPRIDGGDALVTPLNVLIGGQSSPRDSGTQNLRSKAVALTRETQSSPLKVKAAGRDEDAKAAEQVLRQFFNRQRAAVLSQLGAKSPDWWDAERWDRELGEDLLGLAMDVADTLGAETLTELGFDQGFDVDRAYEFLKAIMATRARLVNTTTLQQIEAALSGDLADDSVKATPEGVFDEAEGTRSEQSGVTLATTLAGVVTTEALRQTGRPGVTKTWITTSANPRPAHKRMDGETVGLDEKYSNGMEWPGDLSGAGGDAAEIANCSCISEMTIP